MKRVIFLVAWSLVLTSVAHGAGPYYVDPVGGNNADDGLSQANAWISVAYAEQNAANGSTVYLMTGDYGDISLTDATNGRASMGNALTFTPLAGNTPTIDKITINANTALYLIFDGLTVVSPPEDGDGVTSTWTITNGSYITIQNCTLTGIQGYDAVNGRYDSTLSTVGGLNIGASGNVAVGNITVSNCNVSNTGLQGIGAYGTRNGPVTIDGCTVHDTGGSSLKIEGAVGQLITVSDCKVYDHTLMWIGAEYNHATGVSIRTYPVTIQRNIIRNHGTTSPLTFYQSVFTGTGYQDVLIENNLIYDSEASSLSVSLYDIGNNFTFRNNTIVGFHTGSLLAYYYRQALGYEYANTYTPSTITIANNIIVGLTGLPVAGVVFTGNQLYSVIDSVNNWHDQAELDADFPGNKVYCWNTTTPQDFEPGTNTFGWVGGGTWATYVYDHPPAGFDITAGFRLSATSPAVGFANVSYVPTLDIDGNTRDGDPDAGCFEYAAVESNPPTVASNPSPANAATNVNRLADLSWTSGANNPSHHVYFGTSEANVTARAAGVDKGLRSSASYDPGQMTLNTLYYWCVDEENADGEAAGTVYNFRTQTRLPKKRGVGFRK